MAAAGASAWFYRLVQREPVIVWSIAIGSFGIAVPLIVPPILDTWAGSRSRPAVSPVLVAQQLTQMREKGGH